MPVARNRDTLESRVESTLSNAGENTPCVPELTSTCRITSPHRKWLRTGYLQQTWSQACGRSRSCRSWIALRDVRASRAGQGSAEDRGHRSRGPGNLHPARRRVDRGDGQPGRTQHAANHVNISTLRAVLGTELGGAERVRTLDEDIRHGCATAQHHRHLHHLARIDGPRGAGRGCRAAGATRNRTVSRIGHGAQPCPAHRSPASPRVDSSNMRA